MAKLVAGLLILFLLWIVYLTIWGDKKNAPSTAERIKAEQQAKAQEEQRRDMEDYAKKRKVKDDLAAAQALLAEQWTREQVAPFVARFDCPALAESNVCASTYIAKWDDDGGLHLHVGFTLMNGSIHRTAWCYLRPKHLGQTMPVMPMATDYGSFNCALYNE